MARFVEINGARINVDHVQRYEFLDGGKSLVVTYDSGPYDRFDISAEGEEYYDLLLKFGPG